MAKFQMAPTISNDLNAFTARLGSDAGANKLTQNDIGKLVKLDGESRYNLAAAGDEIEGIVVDLGTGTQDGYALGSVNPDGRISVTFDGSESAGTGNLGVTDYVVVGTPVALGTAQPNGPRVRKATDQAAAKASPFAWRVVSLGTGNGSPGTFGLIERVTG